MKQLTCTNHCGACGRHFHSLKAFDLHRIGDYASNDPETRRRCADPLDLEDRDGRPRLIALGLGECRMRAEVLHDVTIWTTADYRARIASLAAG